VSKDWDHINKLLKSSPDKDEGEPVFPWHELEKRVKRSNFFKFSAMTLNVYYVSIFIIFAIWTGLISYKIVNYNHQLIQNNLLSLKSDSISRYNRNHEKILHEKGRDSNATSTKSSLSQHTVLASNMHESRMFENLLASSLRISDIEVITPLLKHQFTGKQPIIFKFNGDLSVPVDLIIYNNREKMIFEKHDISVNSYNLDMKLSSGLYYWKLVRNDDLLYVGKFFVK
jgi:hypothetical protein